MLEHSAMYLNVTPPYEEETTLFPDFYTRLGPCELQDPVWAKMSALTAGVNKKRKKPETKPQAQINKCNNEKRRREQENVYIEELAELISANLPDMSSFAVKPDKCAILQETVNQIKNIKQQERQSGAGGAAGSGGAGAGAAAAVAAGSSDPVQQGEVSSSRPAILSNDVFGPLLLEALEGFLFVVNGEGRVDYVTENVATYIRFAKEDILGKSIYNFIHHGDHAKFHSNLQPMTIEPWGGGGGGQQGGAQGSASGDGQSQGGGGAPARSKSLDVRFLVKPPDDLDETIEEKQQRVCSYEVMHISSTQVRDHVSMSDEDGGDGGPCLLCVASRISHRERSTCGVEQFTTKLDTGGRIIGVDASGVSDALAALLRRELRGRHLRDLVAAADAPSLAQHLRDALATGQAASARYTLHVAADRALRVHTKSKLFRQGGAGAGAAADSDFIMATHSITGENDSAAPTDPSASAAASGTTTTSTSGVGGPLMTSVMNGARGSAPPPPPPAAPAADASPGASAASFPTFLDNLDLDFPSSTSIWDSLGAVNGPPPWDDHRPESRPQPSPAQPPPNPPTPVGMYGGGGAGSGGGAFDYSPLAAEQNCYEEKDSKAGVLEEASSMQESEKLRNLLLKPAGSSNAGASAASGASSSDASADRNRDRILKELLNQQDDEQGGRDGRGAASAAAGGRGGRVAPPPGTPEGGHVKQMPPSPAVSAACAVGGPAPGNNNMLRQLLNDKNDDDELETKAGGRHRSELLQQLLKRNADDEGGGDCGDGQQQQQQQQQEDTLLRSLGFPPGSPERRGPKRSLDDRDDGKNGSQVSSSGPSQSSELCKRNKMLASLLAKQTPNIPSIPHIPESVISAVPQEKLPRVPDLSKSIQMNSMGQANNSRLGRMAGRAGNYLGQGGLRQQDANRMNQVNSGLFPATSSTDNGAWNNNNNNGPNNNNNSAQSNDPVLSDLLDEVIDIVPDDIMQFLESPEGQPPGNNFQLGVSESVAINNIQKSLMQCETAVKSPASPAISMPGTPPAYSTAANVTSQSGQAMAYPPPPTYPQAKYQRAAAAAAAAAAAGQPYAGGGGAAVLAGQLLRSKQALLQQEQKRRLLQQQKQQQLLIPSNASADAAAAAGAIQNFDSLLNNTVAPNVTLQRSSSVPEAQLSPNYGVQLAQQGQRAGQQPYSPHSQLASPLGQHQPFPQTTVGNYQQQAAAAAAARLSPQAQFTAQLSPRQAYPQGGGQGGAAWPPARMTVQQNPMLNAQLTRPAQQQQVPLARGLNSPGAGGPTRHSPFGGDQFAAPSSPGSAFGQTQYLRLQRANSVPTTAAQLSGGLGSPRPYRDHQQQHPLHAPHHHPPYPPHPHHHQAYQPDPAAAPQYCYGDMPYGDGRGRPPPPPPHVVAPTGGVPVSAGGGGAPSSEQVRQELRAMVGARTAQAQQQLPAGGGRGGQAGQAGAAGQPHELDAALGLQFELPAGASDSPKLWGAMGSDMGSMSPTQPATSRTTMEEARQGDHKSSLLQKLLSE